MRIAACLIALAPILMGADSPYLKLHKTTKDRITRFSAENAAGKSITAYVVVIENSDEQEEASTTACIRETTSSLQAILSNWPK
jgi:hypothetical protein